LEQNDEATVASALGGVSLGSEWAPDVPDSTSSDDMNRLKSLCSIHGVGLVTFALNKQQPDYTVIVPPVNAAPGMFYINNMLERLKASESKLLNKLF
jgi:hypothetical protein